MKNDRVVIKRNNFMFQLPYKLLRLKSISVLFDAMKSDIKVIRKNTILISDFSINSRDGCLRNVLIFEM